MCTVYDVFDSIRQGKLRSADRLPKSWIFFPAGKSPDPAAKEPLLGLSNNCASYTYEGTDSGWGGPGFKFHEKP